MRCWLAFSNPAREAPQGAIQMLKPLRFPRILKSRVSGGIDRMSELWQACILQDRRKVSVSIFEYF